MNNSPSKPKANEGNREKQRKPRDLDVYSSYFVANWSCLLFSTRGEKYRI